MFKTMDSVKPPYSVGRDKDWVVVLSNENCHRAAGKKPSKV